MGEDNILIFGLRTNEVEALKQNGYYPSNYYNDSNSMKINGAFNIRNWRCFFSGYCFQPDRRAKRNLRPYMVLADFESCRQVQEEAAIRYSDPLRWNKTSLINIAASGRFTADRSIEEYSNWIWKIIRIKSDNR